MFVSAQPITYPVHRQASWAAYLAGTSARLLTSITGVDFQQGGTPVSTSHYCRMHATRAISGSNLSFVALVQHTLTRSHYSDQDPSNGRARPVYRAAEVDAMLADVIANLDEGEPLAPPDLRRNAQFGAPGFIATLPDTAPQGINM
mmetsp:Transcript_12841/g.39197  ORF Transcript_12841/g.39197 Transcript_12841/m.39197 type:complete len:146 (-) Transcript_12841:604-1041(-)